MNSIFMRLGPSELLPRYIFAESLFVRRRVLECGAVASTRGRSAHFLAMRGARSVLACDPDLAAVEEAQKTLGGPSLRFRANVFDDLESASFDLVLVADLADCVRAPELLKELRRLVPHHGYLLGGIRNSAGLALAHLMDPEGPEPPPTYGQLLDALTPHFRSIEVATQSPVLGYQLAFERGEGLQVDGSLASAGEAAYFVVVAGQEPSRPFEPTWVQLPPEPLAFAGTRVDEYAQRNRDLEERTSRLKRALDGAREEVASRDADLTRTRGQWELAREGEARLTAQIESLRAGARGEGDRDPIAARVRRLESELQVARERITDAERRVLQHRAEVEKSEKAQAAAQEQVSAAVEAGRLERARRMETAELLEDATGRLGKAQDELRAANDKVTGLRVELEKERMAIARLADETQAHTRGLDAARRRELELAENISGLLATIEALKVEIAEARSSADSTADQLLRKEAELEESLRATALQSEAAQQAREELRRQREQSELAASGRDLDRASLETELASARAESGRLSKERASLIESEGRLGQLVEELEGKLAAAEDDSLLVQLQGQLEAEQARAHRLEHDISTAVAAERSAREQAEAALSDAQTRLLEMAGTHDQLQSRARQLESSADELRLARQADAARTASERLQIGERLARIEEEKRSLERGLSDAQARESALEVIQRESELASKRAREEERRSQELSDKVRQLEERIAGMDQQIAQREQALAVVQEELAASGARVRAAEERAQLAQGAAGAAKLDLQTLSERLESAGAEKRVLEDERSRLTSEVERLEAERAWKSEELDAAQASAVQREAELRAGLADKEARVEVLLRRLSAQESELAVLRRAPRTPANQVQQIYERASAELTAVKAELFRRPGELAAPKRRPPEPEQPVSPSDEKSKP